jgi:HK97 family phage prohead protease
LDEDLLMPYFITDKANGCTGWATVKEDGEVIGCHKTKKDAVDHMVAISLAEDMTPGGDLNKRELRVDTIAPPSYMRAAARRGLKYYEDGQGGAGLVPATIREAREMAAGRVSADKWVRISAWIARHLPDLDAPKNKNATDPAYPGAGLVAHLLWGSGPTKRQALRAKQFADSVVDRLKASSEREVMTDSEQRATVGSIAVGDWVSWSPLLEDDTEYGQVVELAGVQAVVKCFDDENNVWFETDENSLVMIADLTKIEPLMDTNMMVEDDSQRSKWIRAAWAIKGRIENLPQEARSVGKYEVRTTPSEFEVRDSNDGMTISGYAAVFNSPSEPLPFTERIAPGAFQRSLKSRNEIKLLWNHDSGEPMASLRGGSLRLWEDAKGLAYEATLANTTRGRDVAELIRSGVIDAMSFGFNVIKDTWDERGDRVLESVRIHEISVVAWPAYLATAGTVQVRSADGGIDAEALADALLRLESGEELESAHADLIKDVVSKLEKTPEVEEVSGNILDLKQKQLELLMKRV